MSRPTGWRGLKCSTSLERSYIEFCFFSSYLHPNYASINKAEWGEFFNYLVNRQLLRIPLADSFFANIDNRYFDIGTHLSHHGARRATDISSANAANLEVHTVELPDKKGTLAVLTFDMGWWGKSEYPFPFSMLRPSTYCGSLCCNH